MSTLLADPRGPGLLLEGEVEVGPGVTFGAYVVVHGPARLEAGATVEDHVVVGKRPRLHPRSTARATEGVVVVGPGATLCAGAVVFTGARIGKGAVVGDQAYVREGAVVGDEAVVGRGSCVDQEVVVGARARIQTLAYLAARTVVEEEVFVGPAVVTTNDNTLGRHLPNLREGGAVLRRGSRIGAGVVILPGIEVGEEAFVAAGSLLTKPVPPRAVAMGVPARVVGEVGARGGP